MSRDESPRTLLIVLRKRGTPSRALARLERHLGEADAARATFLGAGLRLRERAETRAAKGGFSRAGAMFLDAAGCFLQAGDVSEADILLRRCAVEFASLPPHEQRRLPILAAMAGDHPLAEQTIWALPVSSLGSRLVTAWLSGSSTGLREVAAALREAAQTPPVGPVPPWADHDIWEQVEWADAEAQRT